MRRYAILLSAGMILFQGCGYSLRMVDVVEEDREIRNQQHLEGQVSRLNAQAKAMQEQLTRLQNEVKQARGEGVSDLQKGVSDLQKRRAEVDVRFDESDIQFRIIQGKIEKEERRYAELAQQVDNAAFRLKEQEKSLNEQEKKWEILQKTLQAQVEEMKELKKLNAGFQKNWEDHERRLKEIAGQLLQLTKEIPSALNGQAMHLDELGKRLQQLSRGADVEALGKSLVDLSHALNLLGEKITAKVDEQEKLLDETTRRLRMLESKLTPKGKQSSLQEGASNGVNLNEAEETVGAARHKQDGF